MDSYLDATANLYREAAIKPDVGLCCTTNPMNVLPGLEIPKIMQEMNYGCGSIVSARDLSNSPNILYVGVGGGMELLQFSYFSRRTGGVIGVDIVDEMLNVCSNNLTEAEQLNPWFKRDFVDLRSGSALDLPVEDNSIDIVGQNCLFNIFKEGDLKQALSEVYRVLKPGGRLVMSDPICDTLMNEQLRNDDRLRALCLTGALPLNDYLKAVTDIGFGTIEVRARRPYRIIAPSHYQTDELLYIESVEICAIKDPMPADGPCIFTGKAAIYFGDEEYFDDDKGHVLLSNQPLAVCDKTAANLASIGRADLFISSSTWFYDGGGCC
ncbi:MAG: arsenosugar biosynthesis arsenite methyltransferase ArsM [Daejeonella sp.]|uniref:arsenosugar biosynthesis arsenite methyltransferase ArsM n=1 Tax=Daejeonella sp. TaxID=2805397 RepID=UPI003C706388